MRREWASALALFRCFRIISFAVNEGDRIGLIGPNGAGKSTLLAVLAGEVDPDFGEVAFRKRARVGYVRQISEFAPRSHGARCSGRGAGARRACRRMNTSSGCGKR